MLRSLSELRKIGNCLRQFSTMASKSDRIIWVDCEMTGLDIRKHSIVEIACIVTEGDLKIVEEGPDIVIHQPESVLMNMDDWCKSAFEANGLLEKIRSSNIEMAEAERKILSFVEKYTKKGECPLAGNTVFMDRFFLMKFMPAFVNHLHYRVIDVSSFKEVINRWYPGSEKLEKMKNHRALDDIRESIEELRFYRERFMKPYVNDL
ncbi:hypothetical protein AB6A40_003913 [Gnathostoma spinigerum]|uniref:Probable oligoribonuclease n=1 Tax=Gnathostoma spinigerum TaxID=75299 RepID=A0ABD6EAX7_9BILA